MSDPAAPINFFGQLLAILHHEELIRLRRRCELQGKTVMVEVLTDEIEEREGIQKTSHDGEPQKR